MTLNNGHGVCTKCGWLYLLAAEVERQRAVGYRCRCLHCPCRGLCSVGCKCEAIAEGKRKTADWQGRR